MKYFDFGNPFETEAVINFEHIQEVDSAKLLFKSTDITYKKEKHLHLNYTFKDLDQIFGLGENMRGIDKRGGLYESFCSDDPNHSPDKTALYGAHNFFVISSEHKKVGIFIDFPTKVVFDFGFTDMNTLQIVIHGVDARIYVIEEETTLKIVESFLKAIGPSYLPPRWAFGYQQSRWSYEDSTAIKEIATQFNQNDLPVDSIYLDIDYMDDFKNFTIDKNRFPEFKSFVKEMKEDGIRLIPIIDAGCKIEKDYVIHEEGIKNNYYCVDIDGKPFVGAVWPGKVHFPDFLNPKTRKWFGDHYSSLIELGIEGFWNDMNEPAIFYSEKGLSDAIDYSTTCKDKNLGIYEFFDLKEKFMSISNNIDDYQAFYHRVDDKLYNHYDLHNLYGYNMTRAAGEAFERNYPEKRLLLFSRASYIGMHRYGGIWTGDNHAWWEHLLLNIKMMPSLNMCGFRYSGADVGGFGGHTNAELVTRWSQFALFTPLFRNHACMGTRIQEPFSFDAQTTGVMRNLLRFRYAFVTFLYSEFMKTNNQSTMLFKPMSFEYNDKDSQTVEDQLLFGESLMLAPIYTPNAKGRYVYCPEDMVMWKCSSDEQYDLNYLKEGHHHLKAETNEWLSFIRKNKLVLLTEHANRVDDLKTNILKCFGFVESVAEYQLYLDDGISRKPKSTYLTVRASYDGDVLYMTHDGDTEVTISYDVVTSDQKRHKGVCNV